MRAACRLAAMSRTAAMLAIGLVIGCQFGRAADEAAGPGVWMRGLADEDFVAREEAAGHLREWAAEHPEQARQLFLDRYFEDADPEVRVRCRELLRGVVVVEFRRQGQGFIGIQMIEVVHPRGEGFGIRVLRVQPDTPAEEIGLKPGDTIVGLDGRKWVHPGAMEMFREEIKRRRPGDRVRLQVWRNVENPAWNIELKLMRRPSAKLLALQMMPVEPRQGMALRKDLQTQYEREEREEEERLFKRWLAEQSQRRGDSG